MRKIENDLGGISVDHAKIKSLSHVKNDKITLLFERIKLLLPHKKKQRNEFT